ncbi:hypothetical protein RhiirA5_493526 [Rhizophagus irregularis]|uniref:Uncharacterized protein n=1 Tax=Rhizophagus irregularis TaxID=588596 RepID=A0A2N0QCG5_9GLOM|nr:hypothetical protein RhiirA5_493526 [Rhizophagus irregularis]
MESLYGELKVEIFRYVFTPMSLVLLNRNWYSMSQDPHARAEWIIYKGSCNDLELFHYLTAGAFTINDAPAILTGHLKFIEDLIINKKFIPFPPRPVYNSYSGGVAENYLSRNGYENNRQINLISRAILIHLIILWKKIMKYVDLVVEVTLLVCFPSNPPNNWFDKCNKKLEINSSIDITWDEKWGLLGKKLKYDIIEYIEAFGGRVDILPPYSLDFNPIETCFSDIF